MINAILTKAEKVARSEIGYREGPKNNETKFGDWFGMNFQAWCAIFLSWLSVQSGLTYLGKPWRFASTIAARDHAKKNKRWTTTPTVGTFAMMAHSSTTGHVGFVIYILVRNGEKIIGTIEGNTNDQGAREGNGVWLRERVATSWDGYIVLDQTNEKEATNPKDDDMTLDEHNLLVQIDKRVETLQAIADRDLNILRPKLEEAIELIKASPDHGGVGQVDAAAIVDEFERRLKE